MVRELTIDGYTISDEADCYTIAEIGHNHQGSVETCKEMFSKAKELGANAVKLQKRDNKSLFTKEIYDSPYLNKNSYGDTYGAHREALEFGREEYCELVAYAKEIDITFFSTAFDFNSADFLAEFDMPAYKIASGDLTNIPLLQYIAKIGKPIILSTGGGTLENVQRAYDAIMPINTQLAILQCTAAYPVKPEDMNLRVIETYKEAFQNIVIGLSDHESGIGMALVAYMLGARIVEKHFTLNRALPGTDHAFSLAPNGLHRLTRNLKRARLALGTAEKKRLSFEEKPLYKMGKKLVAARELKAGHVLTREDIAIKSPNDGLPPYELENVLGKELLSDLGTDENIQFDCLK
jgi:sialic acid synthase